MRDNRQIPQTFVRTFRVRHYECDAYGHVNHANYVRYMQEAAFDASAAGGYDMARYQAMGVYWLIRGNEIEYRRPLRYGDSVQIETWVADFRRVRSLRAYEFRLVADGSLVARAQTDWVFLDQETNQPIPIPDDMKASLRLDGAAPFAAVRERWQTPPVPSTTSGGSAAAFRQERRVEWRDLDAAGHVNNAVYLAYVEDCGLQWIRSAGWPLDRLAGEGLAVLARRHQIEYLLPALLNDELALVTWVADVGHTSATRYTLVTRPADGALLARVRTLQLWVDLDSGQPRPIPAGMLQALAAPAFL